MPGKPKKYAPEFKDQAARKVVDNSLPIVQVARELGINESTLGFWVQDYRRKLAGQPLPAERSHASCATHAGPRRSPKRHPATGLLQLQFFPKYLVPWSRVTQNKAGDADGEFAK